MKIKVGVYICECGPNIADNIDIDRIVETLSSLDELKDIALIVKKYSLLCSNEGKAYLVDEINENNLTHLVIAACSPRDHNNTFVNICKKTELNPYLYQLINIREQCAWVIHDKEKATEKAIRYIQGGIRRVLYQLALFERKLDSIPDVLVIGGGIAGIEAAISLASKKRKVFLIEKTDVLGGKAVFFKKLLPRQRGDVNYIKQRVEDAINHENVQIFTYTELEKIIGFLGNFKIVVRNVNDFKHKTELKVGAVVVATGFQLVNMKNLSQYHFDKNDDVYTGLEIEEMISEKGEILMKSGQQPNSVGLIHCVGRKEKGYCSQICCNYMMKIAEYLFDQSQEIHVKAFIWDLCVPQQEDQQYFDNTKSKRVDFIRIKDIELNGTSIKYKGIDETSNETLFDMVVMAPAMEPATKTEDLAELLNIPLDETGFFQEAHQTSNPIATTTDGIYIIGAAHGPKGISETMLQAQAAAGKIITQLIPGEKIALEVKVAESLEAYCMGCKTCLEVCCYGAIYFNEEKGISVVNEALCRGCGNCVGSCPSGAIRLRHFTNPQLYQEIFEALK